ncbi:putative transcriptional regulator [Crenothrix polyspora]|uniref:Putative transcriptional regulator n=1 Tax=Crenothrix polyspora TaxID=360316 RepID=A0A1R4H6U9_9GAMM|nr:HTH domain-containing protein [Crenothrix polyspora]SJM91887.1 putative transcriptional regulator [Crenothrix polyspora]
MPQKISDRQHQILELLLQNGSGLCIDELAKALDISRTAIQQHFVLLESEGYIKKSACFKTAGRPLNIYVITDKGIGCFPKQYAWFSELMLDDLREEIGTERFTAYMQRMGIKLANSLRTRFTGKALNGRVNELLTIMSDLGFHVQLEIDPETGVNSIEARNCIYHELAQKHSEICAFDVAFMSSLLEKEIAHTSCMAKGACHCQFKIGDKK